MMSHTTPDHLLRPEATHDSCVGLVILSLLQIANFDVRERNYVNCGETENQEEF